MMNFDPKQHERRLGLKYQSTMNWATAGKIVIGVFAFHAALIFLTQPNFAQIRYVGAIFTLVLMRVIFGTPVERHLTPESKTKLMEDIVHQMVEMERERTDTDE